MILLLSVSLFAACGLPLDLPPTNEGEIRAFSCSRGCYQYLLEVGGVLYAPDSLPDELKEDGQAVLFEGAPTEGTTMIYSFAPNDVPVPDFEVQNFHIISIEAK